MDGKRFDDLSRALAQGRTRRGVLKGLAGGLAAGVAALTRRGDAAAQRLPNGSACTRATQCASLKCVDGVCCNANCTGQCEGCNLAGAVGTCLPLPAGTQQHGNRPACTGTAVCQASCDGVTRNQCTQYPGLDITCAPGTCEDGFGIIYGCGGDGTCHPLTESCGLYVCNAGGTACLDTCASDADCVGEAFCQNGTCQEDRPLGEDCTADAQCASGICAQGVCCVEACPGACFACNLPGNEGFCTEVPDGGACDGGTCCDGECVDTQSNLEHCGVCDNACDLTPNGPCEKDPICQAGVCTFTPQPQGTLCRESAGICDLEEVCDGVSIVCPPNVFRPPSFECRASAGICDLAEFCTGTGPLCPPDLFQPPSFVCRGAAGPCDVPEFCTGTSAACPPDVFLPNTAECRPAAGPCDVAEFCTGTSAACPPDQFRSSDVECRRALGPCDLAEFCTGTSAACPPDVFRPNTFECRAAAGPCDVAEFCTGNAPLCPPDSFQPNTVQCRAAAGPCDVPEFCPGNAAACPPNVFAPAGLVCRPAVGPCDLNEVCSGTSAACPPDSFRPNTFQCRAGGAGPNAVCDPPENCTGSSAACPPNVFAAAGTTCNDGNPQTVNDACNGQGICVGVPGIDVRRVGGGNMEVDDDLELYVNGNLVFSEHDNFITTYPPFDLNLVNGDQLRVVAFNAQPTRAHIDPFELFRPADGAIQVLDAVGFDETGFGAGLVLGVFYDRTFTVSLP